MQHACRPGTHLTEALLLLLLLLASAQVLMDALHGPGHMAAAMLREVRQQLAPALVDIQVGAQARRAWLLEHWECGGAALVCLWVCGGAGGSHCCCSLAVSSTSVLCLQRSSTPPPMLLLHLQAQGAEVAARFTLQVRAITETHYPGSPAAAAVAAATAPLGVGPQAGAAASTGSSSSKGVRRQLQQVTHTMEVGVHLNLNDMLAPSDMQKGSQLSLEGGSKCARGLLLLGDLGMEAPQEGEVPRAPPVGLVVLQRTAGNGTSGQATT